MTGRRALVGLSLLCALAFTAVTAASASATTTGTTAVTCVDTSPNNTGDYTDAHCDTTGTPGASKYKHESIAQDTATLAKGSNQKTKNGTTESTKAVLTATVGGINVTITCTSVSSTGTLKNSLVGEDHRITGSGITIIYTGCIMTPGPCVVHSPLQANGTIVTNALKSESVEGTPMTQKFSPVGTTIAHLEITDCVILGTYPMTGTISAEPSGQMAAGGGRGASAGATLNVNLPKNASSTLVVAGQKAGLTVSETIVMDCDSEPPGCVENPIASTGPPF